MRNLTPSEIIAKLRGVAGLVSTSQSTHDLIVQAVELIKRPAPTPWRKGSEWTEADGRVLCYDPCFSGPAAPKTYGYNVKRCINPKWHWMPLPQPPQGGE